MNSRLLPLVCAFVLGGFSTFVLPAARPVSAAVQPEPCNTDESSIDVTDLGGSLQVNASLRRITLFNGLQAAGMPVDAMVRKSVPFSPDVDYHRKVSDNGGFGMHDYSTAISKDELGLPASGATLIWVKFAITGGPDVHTCRFLVWR